MPFHDRMPPGLYIKTAVFFQRRPYPVVHNGGLCKRRCNISVCNFTRSALQIGNIFFKSVAYFKKKLFFKFNYLCSGLIEAFFKFLKFLCRIARAVYKISAQNKMFRNLVEFSAGNFYIIAQV